MQMTSDQQDVMTEIINVGIGRAAASLSELLGKRIALQVPAVTICNISDLSERLRDEESGVDLSVVQDFQGGLSGRAMLAFPRRSGIELGKMLGGVDSSHEELSIDLIGILEEVGNIVLNGVLGTVGNMTSLALDYSVPRLAQGVEVTRMLASHASEQNDTKQMVILADTRFTVAEDSITGSLILLFDIQSLRSIMRNLIEPAAECR